MLRSIGGLVVVATHKGPRLPCKRMDSADISTSRPSQGPMGSRGMSSTERACFARSVRCTVIIRGERIGCRY